MQSGQSWKSRSQYDYEISNYVSELKAFENA